MKKSIPIFVFLALLVSVLPVGANSGGEVFDPASLFVPDITDVRFESELILSNEAELTALPSVLPYNADMVNVENVENDGTGVYVAVLDTGLLDFAFFLLTSQYCLMIWE